MPSIRQRVLIGAPASRVYDALTSREGLSSWWTAEVGAEPEPNSIACFGFRRGYAKEMRVTDLAPGRRVAWCCIDACEEWKGTRLSFDLKESETDAIGSTHAEMSDQLAQQHGDGVATLLSFEHAGWRGETAMFAECSYTWGRFLRSLKLYCETGEGRPWPHQHRLDRKPDLA